MVFVYSDAACHEACSEVHDSYGFITASKIFDYYYPRNRKGAIRLLGESFFLLHNSFHNSLLSTSVRFEIAADWSETELRFKRLVKRHLSQEINDDTFN